MAGMMAGGCAPGSGGELPVGDLLALADCRADALGWGGYQALGHGTWFATILTGLLTVAIAFQGYRLLAGRTPDLHQGLAGLARIGLAIALSGSVGAYGTLVYRVATQGPFEISSRLTDAAGLSAGDLPSRLDALYTAIRLDPETRGRIAGGGDSGSPRPASPVADGGQRSAATLFVMVSAGPWVALQMTTALLLALGPFAALFLLFDATLGLFVNWLRALGGMMIALAGLAVAIPLELEALEPVIARAGAGTPDYTAVVAILGVFAILSGAILLAAHTVTGFVAVRAARARRLRGDGSTPVVTIPTPSASVAMAATAGATLAPTVLPPPAPRSHAAAVTNAIAGAARRSSPTGATIDADRTLPRGTGLAPRAAPAATAISAVASHNGRRGLPQLRPAANRTSPR